MLTYKRVFLWLFVFAFAPQVVGALRWALPVVLDLGTQPSVEALASDLIAVAITAALLYAVLRGLGALWECRARPRRR